MKVARPVLSGRERREALPLPDHTDVPAVVPSNPYFVSQAGTRLNCVVRRAWRVAGPVALGGRLRKMAPMPTVLRVGPYRFFFYAGDGSEPSHIHVERDDSEAKFWLDPVRLERTRGFGRKEIKRVRDLVEEYRELLLGGWNEFFRG